MKPDEIYARLVPPCASALQNDILINPIRDGEI